LPLAILTAAFAQGPGQPAAPRMQPPSPPLESGALQRYLNLSDAQIDQIQIAQEEGRKEAAEKANTLGPQLREKRDALNALMARRNAGPAAVGKAMMELRGLERQQRQLGDQARNRALAVLTPEQRTKFKAIEDAASLPAATQEAMRMGLVPGTPG